MIPRMDNPINGYLLRDKKGNLLPGGRLEFFDSTTDLPENVWVAGSNPLESLGAVVYADAYGLLADFELTPNKDYTLRCYNSDGDFIWDREGIANNVSDLEDRVEALESTVGALGDSSGLKNLLTNGGCKALRHQAPATAFPVKSTFSLGQLSGVFARVLNVTGGTFKRVINTGFGITGVYAQLDDVTTDNSEAVAELQWRMPAGDGAAISGDSVVFSVKASQNSGDDMDAYVTLYKCLTEEDYGSLVSVAASTPVTLSSGAATDLELAVENPGDVSTGVAVVVTFDCGIVTNTNFIAGEAQLERGQNATTFEDRPQYIDEAAWSEEDLVGVGELKWFPATSAPPGTIIADGTELNRADYPRLWAWANTYGRVVDDATWTGDATANNKGCFSSGDGTDTFRAPDLVTQLAFIRAHDTGGSRDQGELQLDAFQDHGHGGEDEAFTEHTFGGKNFIRSNTTGTPSSPEIVETGGGEPRTDNETRPINYDMLPCIKY